MTEEQQVAEFIKKFLTKRGYNIINVECNSVQDYIVVDFLDKSTHELSSRTFYYYSALDYMKKMKLKDKFNDV